MPAQDYRDILDVVEEIETRVKSRHPNHAKPARDYINGVLKRVDMKMYHAFNGQGYYDPVWVGELGTVYSLIAGWFEANQERTEWPHHILENMIKCSIAKTGMSEVRDAPLDH